MERINKKISFIFISSLLVVFLFESCAGIYRKKDVLLDSLEREKIKSGKLEDRVEFLESEVDRLNIRIKILQDEVEGVNYRVIKAYEIIREYNPKIESSLAFKIAQNVVIVSDSYGIDFYLVLAIMRMESNFKPNAKSYAGARGLMQVMPFWAKHYGIGVSDLWNVETNIEVGIGILDYYLDECNQNVDCALGKYHGSYPACGRGSYAYNVQADYHRLLRRYNKGVPSLTVREEDAEMIEIELEEGDTSLTDR